MFTVVWLAAKCIFYNSGYGLCKAYDKACERLPRNNKTVVYICYHKSEICVAILYTNQITVATLTQSSSSIQTEMAPLTNSGSSNYTLR